MGSGTEEGPFLVLGCAAQFQGDFDAFGTLCVGRSVP